MTKDFFPSFSLISAEVLDVGADLVLLFPIFKQLHEGVALLHQLRVQALRLGKGQDGLQRALHLAGRPQASAGGGQAVVHQALLVFNHFFKDGRLALHPVGGGGGLKKDKNPDESPKETRNRQTFLHLRVRKQLGLVVGEKFVRFAENAAEGQKRERERRDVIQGVDAVKSDCTLLSGRLTCSAAASLA